MAEIKARVTYKDKVSREVDLCILNENSCFEDL